jgi:2-hydroxy-6-oxonona-2,4-dienedioate hydrolase
METIWAELLGEEIRQTYYNAGGVRTRALEAGSGPPLIFLHGTGGHAECYVRNIAAHARHFHVYAIDFVGHGYSDMPDLAYGVQDFVSHVRSFLDAIGAKRAAISGESLGGMTGAWLAALHPDRVESLVLNTGILMPLEEEGRKDVADVLQRSRAASGQQLTREGVRKRMEWLMADPKSVTDELVEIRFKIYSQPGRAAVMRKVAETLFGISIDRQREKELFDSDQLKKIQCPTLVLWTTHNPGQSAALAERGTTLIPNARMTVFENSAHWPQWEEPEQRAARTGHSL